jgi:hypothetical protein
LSGCVAAGDVDFKRAGTLHEISRVRDPGRSKEDEDRMRLAVKAREFADTDALQLTSQTAVVALQDARIWTVAGAVNHREHGWKLISLENADDRIRRHSLANRSLLSELPVTHSPS